MDYEKSIFKRATVRGIAAYLLDGQTEKSDNRDYKTRMDEAFALFDKEALKLDKRQPPPLLDNVNALVSETADVYTEIGLQAGVLLMLDAIKNINSSGTNAEMTYRKMYDSLFNDVLKALDILKEGNPESANMAASILKAAQCKTEEIFMSSMVSE